jgi:hypothetical protein
MLNRRVQGLAVWRNVYRRIRFFRKMYPLRAMAEDAVLLPLDYLRPGRPVSRVRNLTMTITHRCNIKCEMCYFHEELADRRQMPLELFKTIVDRLALDESGSPGLVFLSEKAGPPYGCPHTIRELKLLRRKRDWQGDQWGTGAFKGRDDAVDALRYGLQSKPRPHGLQRNGRSSEFYEAQRRARQEAARRAPMHRPLIGSASHLNLVAL